MQRETYVLGPTDGDTGDAWDLLQAEADESLPGFSLRARLDLLESSIGCRVLNGSVIVTLMVGVVRSNFLDSGGHLERRDQYFIQYDATASTPETRPIILCTR